MTVGALSVFKILGATLLLLGIIVLGIEEWRRDWRKRWRHHQLRRDQTRR
jgi:hypothetical protein